MKRFLRRKSSGENSTGTESVGKPLLFFSCRELIKISVDLMAECYALLAEARLRDLELGESSNIAITSSEVSSEDLKQKILRLSDILREIAQKCIE